MLARAQGRRAVDSAWRRPLELRNAELAPQLLDLLVLDLDEVAQELSFSVIKSISQRLSIEIIFVNTALLDG